MQAERAEGEFLTEAPTFRDFIRDAWHLLEPVSPFVDGWHIGAIAEHLSAITAGELRNLIINIPPRSGKSSLVAVLWPAWTWIEHPGRRWLYASYSLGLSVRDSVKCRRLIESAWYQERWSDRYRLTGDQNTKASFENDKTGHRLATSVGGSTTGAGGDVLVVDDPTSAEQADSDAKRVTANDWYDGTMSTRGNDPATVARVVIQQRLHEQDLTGHILGTMAEGGEQYDHLVLPAEYEPRVQVCLAGLGHDQRTEPGEPLSPERFSAAVLAPLKIVLGDRAAGQLQQRPAPAGGAIYLVDQWWGEGRNRYRLEEHDADPTKVAARFISLDTAMKDADSNDFTACVVADLRADYKLRIREVWVERLQFHELLDALTRTIHRWDFDGKLIDVVIEDKGSGTSAIQTLQNGADPRIAAFIQPFMPTGSKVYRYRQSTQALAWGCVELPHPSHLAPWLFDFEAQLKAVPAAAHDDMADAFAQLIIWLDPRLSAGYHARGGAVAA